AMLPPPPAAPQPAPPVDTTAQRVRGLVEQAHRQMASKRLTTPPGDNAFETVQRIRELTPQAPEIAQLIAAMVDTYRRWAALAERDGAWGDARSFYERALLVTPDDADLRTRLKDAEERSRRADSPPAQPDTKEPALPSHTATFAGFAGSADTLALLKAPDRLEAMLAAGANPNHRFDDGKTVLMQAAEHGLGAAVGRLLGAGASPNPRSRDGATALMYASYNGHGDVVALLADAGADINASNADGKTALMAAATRGHASVVRALLTRGAVIDHATAQGWTALMYAANAGQERVARLLVEHGADPHRTDAEGRSALAMGRQRGSVQLVQALTRR
ncbi:MAG TPA: ankyrin repeat domain-containing protein, partial [Azospirillum sp.]